MSKSRLLLACTLVLALSSIALFGQLDQGQISGTIKDGSDAFVPGASITALNTGNGRTTSAISGPNGSYLLTNLPVGTYEVTVEFTGFRKSVQQNVKVDAAARAIVDLTLEVGSASDTINVDATAVAVQSETAQIGRVVESRQITDLALNGRNPIYLTLLKAGVIGGNFATFNPTQMHETFSINGGRRNGNNFSIDGVNAVRTRGDTNGNAQLGVFNADTIQEVQILTTNYPAEYGHAMDGQIRFVTKSGTRDFHGTAWEFLRNAALDANSWVRNSSSNPDDSRRAAPFRFNQPGYAIGGPVYIPGKFNTERNKLFFFVSQEWMYYRREKTSTAVVPTAAMRRGDFSELLSPSNPFFRAVKTLKDPLSGQPFAGNIIPASRLSANGIGILNGYPLPTPGFIQGSNNWIKSHANPKDSKKDLFRADYYAGQHRISFVGQHFTYTEDDPFNTNLDISNSRWDRPNSTASLSITSTLSPTVINDLTATAANDVVHIGIFDTDGQPLYLRTRYGLDFPYILPGSKRIPQRVPNALITGFNNLDGSSRPVSSSGPMYTVADNLTWIRSSGHTFKFGFSYERAQQNNNDQTSIQNGQFTFLDSGNPLTSGVAIGNVALGNFDLYEETGTAAYTLLRSGSLEAYAQDTWKVRPRLTIEMGVRYSNHEPWFAKWNDLSNFDPGYYNPANRAMVDPTRGFIVSGDPYNGIVLPGTGVPESARGRAQAAFLPNVERLFHDLPRGFVNSYNLAFAPRLGIAYRVSDKTAVRMGGGVYHHRMMFTQEALFRNAPNQPRVTAQNGLVDLPGGNGRRDFPFDVNAIDKNYKYPTAYSYSLSVQRELPGAAVLEVAYVGKTGVNLERFRNINQLQPGTRQAYPSVTIPNALRPYQGLGTIKYVTHDARSNYNSLQVSLDRRFTSGLGLGLSYTFSKALDNTTSIAYNAYGQVKALDPIDRTHLLNLNFILESPFLKSSQGFTGAVLGRWQLSGVMFLRSGVPLSVTDSTDIAGVGPGSGAQPWNLVGNTASSNQGINKFWFNPAAFALPTAGTFGNAGLNILRGPSFKEFDLALFKNFTIVERLSSQFRFEVFNVPNHPILADPGTNPRSGTFGLITSKTGERNVQLGLKFIF